MTSLLSYVGVGELFDHGLDSWAAILLPLSIYSGIGIGKPWGTNAAEGYPALLCKEGERGEEEEERGERRRKREGREKGGRQDVSIIMV